ncbi:tRNA 2-thiocytidine biosynthesis TtcA family protein [Butyrivibrio sp. AE3009]|uniref:tRNA 2-thiocytidine biosynthesis TtcA family protein n=1 Tax=Butyrivibrio sp. AE3009 TaxID=1280666 RepID=UPI0003B7218F|nr:ATP-binding protein [Butyrivibrio sp. AE3009]
MSDTRNKEIERSIIKKFRPELWSQFTKAINTYKLIKDGDKIAVCISGGKDSMLMAKLFQELHRHGKKNFEVEYIVMNPGYNTANYENILKNLELMQVPATVFDSDIFKVVDKEVEGSPCYLCARMRRGALYAKAKELGCNKIALGHHYDDVIETILMGMLYGGQIQTMMPKLHSSNFEDMELIRPLYLIREEDVKKWAAYNDLKFINCACRMTEMLAKENDLDFGSKRAETKALIAQLREMSPYIEANIFKSVENVHLNALIAYKTPDGNRHHFLDRYDEYSE